jgi:hypothetical protein
VSADPGAVHALTGRVQALQREQRKRREAARSLMPDQLETDEDVAAWNAAAAAHDMLNHRVAWLRALARRLAAANPALVSRLVLARLLESTHVEQALAAERTRAGVALAAERFHPPSTVDAVTPTGPRAPPHGRSVVVAWADQLSPRS